MAAQDSCYWQNSLEFAEAEKAHHQNLAKKNRRSAEVEVEIDKEKAKKPKAKAAKKNKAPPTAATAIATTATATLVVKEKTPEATERGGGHCSLASEVAKAREHIKKSLECMDTVLASVPNVPDKTVCKLESELEQLKSAFADLKLTVVGLQAEIKELKSCGAVPRIAICPMKPPEPTSCPRPAVCPMPARAAPKPADDDDDDGVDLFGSDSEDDAEAAKIRDQRLAAYAAKKSKKPALIAKSNIILDCKPWDDETDMKAMEEKVRSVTCDGLLWGASKLVPLAYGIQKLQISCVIEDDKVSVDWLQEEIEKFEDFVQSVDIAAFNKV